MELSQNDILFKQAFVIAKVRRSQKKNSRNECFFFTKKNFKNTFRITIHSLGNKSKNINPNLNKFIQSKTCLFEIFRF